jgi:hypothetical protein
MTRACCAREVQAKVMFVQRVAGGSAQGHVTEQATHTLFQTDSNEQQVDTKVIMCDSRADNMTIRIPHVLSTHPYDNLT